MIGSAHERRILLVKKTVQLAICVFCNQTLQLIGLIAQTFAGTIIHVFTPFPFIESDSRLIASSTRLFLFKAKNFSVEISELYFCPIQVAFKVTFGEKS
jgi:hypothetical protein